MVSQQMCPCGSGKLFFLCCEKYLTSVDGPRVNPNDTMLLGWVEKYAPSTGKEFMQRGRTYLFRISWYLDGVLERYLPLGFARNCKEQQAADEMIYFIKHNTLLSICGALSCLADGLFIQSGMLLRSVLENCMVLVDVFENQEQLDRMLQDKYSTSKVIARVKKLVPDCLVKWYGYFSANFAHFGPLHPAPYMPRKCWPDNWVFVTGIQNIVRGSVAFGIILERVYFGQSARSVFWKDTSGRGDLVFDQDSSVWNWVDDLGEEIIATYPPNKPKEGFEHTRRTYKLK